MNTGKEAWSTWKKGEQPQGLRIPSKIKSPEQGEE
jgi:predicted RNase H-like HicB family nuclease